MDETAKRIWEMVVGSTQNAISEQVSRGSQLEIDERLGTILDAAPRVGHGGVSLIDVVLRDPIEEAIRSVVQASISVQPEQERT